jgi:CheY-like chemotaxis protein
MASEKTVLVVDGYAKDRKVLAQLLEELGCETLQVETGEQALEIMFEQEKVPDMVITAMNLPLPTKISGFEIAKAVKAKLPGVPVIVITEDYSDYRPIFKTWIRRTFHGRLEKPFHRTAVKNLIEKILPRIRSLAA